MYGVPPTDGLIVSSLSGDSHGEETLKTTYDVVSRNMSGSFRYSPAHVRRHLTTPILLGMDAC